MQKLENRIAALESTMPSKGGITAIWNIILNQDFSRPDIDHVTDHAGGVWLRLPGETAQALQDRASNEASRNMYGIASFTAMEVGQHAAH